MAGKETVSKSMLDVVSTPAEEDQDRNAPVVLDSESASESDDGKKAPPLLAKLFAVLLISCISFGSHWSSGVTGAMKSTIKKEMHINNVQFSLLEASEDFMATVLLIPSGLVTDRVGGAGELHLHNLFAEEVMRANAVRLKK
jgi:hypothetical protein